MYSKIGCGMNFLKKAAFLAGLMECNFSSRACRKASLSTTKLHTSSKEKKRKKCRINSQIVSLLVSGVNSDVSMRILWNARLHASFGSVGEFFDISWSMTSQISNPLFLEISCKRSAVLFFTLISISVIAGAGCSCKL